MMFFSFQGLAQAYDFETDSGAFVTGTNAYGSDNAVVINRPLSEIIADIIRFVLTFIGVFFLILALYAGFKWMTSAGNDDKIGDAKKTLQNAIIGIIVVLAAYAITVTIASIFS